MHAHGACLFTFRSYVLRLLVVASGFQARTGATGLLLVT